MTDNKKGKFPKLRALSLFSGIGGIDIAAIESGVEITSFCEIDPFPKSILEKRFPNIPIVDDVRTIKGEEYAGTVNFIYGGFPCQDLSIAGRREGLEGERSKLWFEMLRVIRECRPDWVLAENVRGAINKALDTVKDGLEKENYQVRTIVVPASAYGAPHRRERMFVVGIRNDVAEECLRGLASLRLNNEASYESLFFNGATVSLFPTPTGKCGRLEQTLIKGKCWPSPTVSGNYNKKGLSKNSGDGLYTAVQAQWRTPSARDYRTGSERKHGKQINLNDQVRGQLNPNWVSQLMGFPFWWTDLAREIYYAVVNETTKALQLITAPPNSCDELSEMFESSKVLSWAELYSIHVETRNNTEVSVPEISHELSADKISFADWASVVDKYIGKKSFWRSFAEVGYIPCSFRACYEVWKLLPEKEKYILIGSALGIEMWPAALGARLWMTPQAGACGMTAKTTGRPLEKSTHLQTQVYFAEKLWGTPYACDCNGNHGGGQAKSLRTDVSDTLHDLVSNQYPFEFPRTIVKGGKGRPARIKALGNAVVPAQVAPIIKAIVFLNEVRKHK